MKVLPQTFDRLFALLSGRENACGKKHRYQSPVQATKAAYNMEVKYPGEYFDVYQCIYCDYYHIGHAIDPMIFGFEIIHDPSQEDETPT